MGYLFLFPYSVFYSSVKFITYSSFLIRLFIHKFLPEMLLKLLDIMQSLLKWFIENNYIKITKIVSKSNTGKNLWINNQ